MQAGELAADTAARELDPDTATPWPWLAEGHSSKGVYDVYVKSAYELNADLTALQQTCANLCAGGLLASVFLLQGPSCSYNNSLMLCSCDSRADRFIESFCGQPC